MSRNKTSRRRRHDTVTGRAASAAVNSLHAAVVACCPRRGCKRPPGHRPEHGAQAA